MPRRAVGISVLFEWWGKAVLVVRWQCPAGREAGSKCPRLSRITVCITKVAGFDVQAERKVCGRHSGACNGYPKHTIEMRSAGADFVPVGGNHHVERVAKTGRSSKFRPVALNREPEDRRWLVPRSASGTSALIEHWNSGVG
ncbi:hypothetical protein LF1_53320 [Rubripirellula obstinata]|uniref:Uncharacterized protein n=1 Tax=Rubripirellula obstinata TaxID=406547 RepID=A0A5B1C7D9_9BACT|nr:hypothetical protein LF1_57060 [Rubripirellula obstinata]KAA1257483.1 hypothetical protein LF1_53320 [Rubripirellula obstinata]